MRYLSTRDNHPPVASARAIALGMVPGGGLFVPDDCPRLDEGIASSWTSYAATATGVLAPLLDDFSPSELETCIRRAYGTGAFSEPDVVRLRKLDGRRHVLELFHGPTAAFKDVALQIMPEFMAVAKAKGSDRTHTVILVATSGDTGKAALEGFKDREGISIVVFYPHGGVSEVQRLQMATTAGANTRVVAVRGNFDDCQTAVKAIFADAESVRHAAQHGCSFSSANSINWGRLCPQIVYYVYAYRALVASREIAPGDPIDVVVPTGNFGNILAASFARKMGVPMRRLLCASNKNRVLADFFATGLYDKDRVFYRTMSPSMDILISSNLERFLFDVTGRDASYVRRLYEDLTKTGRFQVGGEMKAAMAELVQAGWVDEDRVLATIRGVFERSGYLLDTHTAVGVAVADELAPGDVPTVIASTASPFKFGPDVLFAITGERSSDEFAAIDQLARLSSVPVHRAVAGLRDKSVRHDRVVEVGEMKGVVAQIVADTHR